MEETYEVITERIKNQSNSLHAMELRKKILQGLLFAPLDVPNSEYVVITGCHGPFGLLHLSYLTNLFRHLGVSFTFLGEEECCGNSYLKNVKKDDPADKVTMLEESAVRSIKQNITRAKELGTNKIVTACAGCTTRYNHFLGDDDSLDFFYYPQILLKYIDSPELPMAVNFYEACHKNHRTSKYNIDTESPKSLLERIRGLEIKEIPNFCCMTDKGIKNIFERADTGTIVTPTSCCFSYLRRGSHKEKGPRIRTLTEVICEAMGVQNTIQ